MIWSRFTSACGTVDVPSLTDWNVDSWIEPNFGRCFQLMRCDDPRLFEEWVLQWRCFGVTFEIVPVVPSKETQAVVTPYLDPAGG